MHPRAVGRDQQIARLRTATCLMFGDGDHGGNRRRNARVMLRSDRSRCESPPNLICLGCRVSRKALDRRQQQIAEGGPENHPPRERCALPRSPRWRDSQLPRRSRVTAAAVAGPQTLFPPPSNDVPEIGRPLSINAREAHAYIAARSTSPRSRCCDVRSCSRRRREAPQRQSRNPIARRNRQSRRYRAARRDHCPKPPGRERVTAASSSPQRCNDVETPARGTHRAAEEQERASMAL